MTEADAAAVLLAALGEVAPEVDAAGLAPDVPLLDQVDLDSMDFLAFVAGVEERAGVAVPERDYPRLATLAAGASYLAARRSPGARDG
ncbi:acyl carrier protein [Miltoncostaea marina]|uniref:acyl carrier protein n=1 Tax=Miltoncostaea marina TaxID=2843215 RepID=UPI001C3D9C4E|nr:acyl carrier protein [Miltoncostaea marina]